MAKILFTCAHGREDPERAILPFVAATVAAHSGQDAKVVLTIEAVWLATKGGADGVVKDGFPPLPELIDELVSAGGELWACSACTRPRGIGEDQLVPGATIVGAATVVEELAGGARSVAFS